MAEQFAIVPASSSVTLDASRMATVPFTVFNASRLPVNGQALLVSINSPGQPWLTLYGEAQQTFPVAGAQQYAVQVAIPPTAPAGIYSFRLDMIDTARPGEGYVMGPTVTIIATEANRAQKKADSSVMQALPRWLAAFGAALVVVALGTYFIWRGAENKRTSAATSATAQVIAATVQAAQLQTSVAQTVVAQGGGEGLQPDEAEAMATEPVATEAVQAAEATPTEAGEAAQPTATGIEPTEAPTTAVPPTTEPTATTASPTAEAAATTAPTYTLAPTQTPLPTYTIAPSNTPEPTSTATELPTNTTVPSHTPEPTITPTVTETTAPLGYRMSDFIGVWENEDANTSTMTKLIIAKVNDTVVSLNGFGKCSPSDCDWGVVNTAFTPYQIVATQDAGFKMRIMSVERSGAQLKAEVFNDYPPDDSRDDTTYYCTMKRNLSVLPLGPQIPGLNKTLVFSP